MGKDKLRVSQTEPSLLLSELRGEVGEIVTTWILLRNIMVQKEAQRAETIEENVRNPNWITLSLLIEKLRDEIIARLSELGEAKVSQLTFHLASRKFSALEKETQAYAAFMRRHRLKEKRDSQISHKEVPKSWHGMPFREISYRTILVGIATSLRLIKKFDRIHLGPSAPYLWRKMRQRRYDLILPPRAKYSLLPYLHLTPDERVDVIIAEMQEGMVAWEPLKTTVDGGERTVHVYRKWAGVILDRELVVLEVYPLGTIENITRGPANGGESELDDPDG